MGNVSQDAWRRLAGWAGALVPALVLIGTTGSAADSKGSAPRATADTSATRAAVATGTDRAATTADGPRAPEEWVGVPVLLKDAGTALRVGPKVVARNDLQRKFVVEESKGDWLWVSSGTLKGWVKRDEVIPFDRAIRHFTGVIRSDPTASWAYLRRALVWYEKGEFDIAIGDDTEAIQLDPKNPLAFANRAIARMAKKDYDGALADFDAALRLDPNDATTLADRGIAHLARKDDDRALADLDAALRLDPKDAAAHNYRGNAWARKGQYERAIADYSEALRLNPKDVWADNSLAWLLATCPEARFRDGKGAVALATEANRQTGWTRPYHMGTLAAASAEAGDFNAAVRWQERALMLFPEDDPDLKSHRARLELYRSKRAYRDALPQPRPAQPRRETR